MSLKLGYVRQVKDYIFENMDHTYSAASANSLLDSGSTGALVLCFIYKLQHRRCAFSLRLMGIIVFRAVKCQTVG